VQLTSSTSPHSRSDKTQICTFHNRSDFGSTFFCGHLTNGRVTSSTKTARGGRTNVEYSCAFGFGSAKGLSVGVYSPKVYAGDTGIEHSIHLFVNCFGVG
jgi:hypothetical protein